MTGTAPSPAPRAGAVARRAALPREFALALACCRWPPSPAREEAVARAAERVDWAHVLRVVRRHRVEALADDALRRAGVDIPADAALRLRSNAHATASQNLAFAAESKRLSGLLDAAGIDHLFVKGLTLNLLAYGSLGLKRSCDIDILIDPARYGAACDLIAEAGYECLLPGPTVGRRALLEFARAEKDTSWAHRGKRVKVELHQRLLPNPVLLPGIGLASPRQEVEIVRGIRQQTLAKEELFAYLCAHGGLTAWSRLKWLADLCALLKEDAPEEIERLYRFAQRNSAGRAAAGGLLLGHRLLALPLPSPLVEELEGDRANLRLVRLALGMMLQGEAAAELDEVRFGTLRIHATTFILKPGWRYKASEVKRKLGVAKARRIMLLDALKRRLDRSR